MPIILERQSEIRRSCTPQEKEKYMKLITWFRMFIADDNPERNILMQKRFTYKDEEILTFFDMAANDINLAFPITNYSLFQIYEKGAPMLLVRGAVIYALIREGLVNVKNMVNYNDYGLTVSFFDKAPHYQSWIGTLLGEYVQAKQQFKQTITANSVNSGFYGVESEFAYMDIYNGAY